MATSTRQPVYLAGQGAAAYSGGSLTSPLRKATPKPTAGRVISSPGKLLTLKGERGPAGPRGATGAVGAAGPKGEKGEKGDVVTVVIPPPDPVPPPHPAVVVIRDSIAAYDADAIVIDSAYLPLLEGQIPVPATGHAVERAVYYSRLGVLVGVQVNLPEV